MGRSPSMTIWRVRADSHLIRCEMEQIGEECFELRVYRGRDLVLTQSFDDVPPLLARADQLRSEYRARRSTRQQHRRSHVRS